MQVADIARELRREIGVDERGGNPLKLGPTRHDFVAQRDVLNIGELFEDDFLGPQFIGGVHERKEVHDRDRGHAKLFESLHTLADRGFIEGQERVAFKARALRNRDAVTATRDWFGATRGRIPDLFFVATTHLDFVTMTFGDEQSGWCTVHLDHGVVAGRGAVHNQLKLFTKVVC